MKNHDISNVVDEASRILASSVPRRQAFKAVTRVLMGSLVAAFGAREVKAGGDDDGNNGNNGNNGKGGFGGKGDPGNCFGACGRNQTCCPDSGRCINSNQSCCGSNVCSGNQTC